MKLITLVASFLSAALLLALASAAQSESTSCAIVTEIPVMDKCGGCKLTISGISSHSAKINISGVSVRKLIDSGYLDKNKWDRLVDRPNSPWRNYFLPLGVKVMETGQIFKINRVSFLNQISQFNQEITGLEPDTSYTVIIYSSFHKQLEIAGDRQNRGLPNIKSTDPLYSETFIIPFIQRCFRTETPDRDPDN